MDITALENELKAGKLNNIYLLYGEERFLLDNNVKKIKKLFGKTVNGINYIQIDNGLVAAIAVNVEEPMFESQTKIKLGSTNMSPGGITVNKFVGDFIKQEVDNFLHKHADVAEIMLQKIQDYSKSLKEEKALQLKKKHQKKMTINLRIS